MLQNIGELDEAELKVAFRSMYKTAGFDGSVQCLYELMKAAEILSLVIIEEKKKDLNEEEKGK